VAKVFSDPEAKTIQAVVGGGGDDADDDEGWGPDREYCEA
jgi:hypothetical protein